MTQIVKRSFFKQKRWEKKRSTGESTFSKLLPDVKTKLIRCSLRPEKGANPKGGGGELIFNILGGLKGGGGALGIVCL